MADPVNTSAYLEAIGITQWVLRDSPSIESDVPDVIIESNETVAASTLDWPALEQTVAVCTQCPLCEQRTQAVFGVGNQQADWLIIGEAPGEQEDLQGEPFVGKAGLLLNNMLTAVGLDRHKAYIANIAKCRPPQNRDPAPEEIEKCLPYLQRQVELIQPKLILVVGRIAAQTLLKTDTPVGKLRGQIHTYPDTDIPMIVTYHPAYLLRRPSEKRKSWDDLKLALTAIQ